MTGKIDELGYGELDDNMQIGLVTENDLETVLFFDLNGIKSEENFKDAKL